MVIMVRPSPSTCMLNFFSSLKVSCFVPINLTLEPISLTLVPISLKVFLTTLMIKHTYTMCLLVHDPQLHPAYYSDMYVRIMIPLQFKLTP